LQRHEPLEQVARVPQALPQKPQWVVLVRRFASQPVAQLLSQLPQFALHVHEPLMQVALAPQELPQPPQCDVDVR
jgi:hypothetical protein